jgi:hypothetical protein
MSDSDAFREWFESKLKDARETNDKDFHASLSRYVGFYQYGFEAAWQHQQQIIDDLLVQNKVSSTRIDELEVEGRAAFHANNAMGHKLMISEAQLAIAVVALEYYAEITPFDGKATEALDKIRKAGE